MAVPLTLAILETRLTEIVAAANGGEGDFELSPGRPFRSSFEALAACYLEFCDQERRVWLDAEPEELAALGARVLGPLSTAVLAKAGGASQEEGFSSEEACLSIWALLDGSIRKALLESGGTALAQAHRIAAARALEYMVGGLAVAKGVQEPS